VDLEQVCTLEQVYTNHLSRTMDIEDVYTLEQVWYRAGVYEHF
jgi:hypothetical protein